MKKCGFLIWLLLVATIQPNPFTARFLQFPVGAVNLSSGNGSILSYSNESMISNPATVSWLKSYQAAVSCSKLPFDRQQVFGSLILQNQGIKFGLTYFEYRISEIEERNLNGQLTGHFQDVNQLFILTTGFIWKKLKLGMNIKYLNESIYEQKGNAILFDLGVLYAIGENKAFSYSISNINLPGILDGDLQSRLRWKVDLWEDKQTHFEYPIGQKHLLAYQQQWNKLHAGLSWLLIQGEKDQFNLALHYDLAENITAKAAWYDRRPVWGLSLFLKLWNRNSSLDYAISQERYSGEYRHLFSWSVF